MVDSTAFRRVDKAQQNPPIAAGTTRESNGWWMPTPKSLGYSIFHKLFQNCAESTNRVDLQRLAIFSDAQLFGPT